MKKFGKVIVKNRLLILLLSVLLLIPSAIGYIKTRVNYDILTYLPKEIETMVGQDILTDEFGVGAFSMLVVEDMDEKDVSKLKAEIEEIPHVEKVVWYDSVLDLSIPMEMLPQKIYDAFNNGDATMMAVFYDQTTSADSTMEAIQEIRSVCDERCFLSGMSAVVTDTKNLSEQETPVYVVIAVLLCAAVLSLTMDSWLVPVFFLISIGMAIVYNLGSNIFLGQISYITKALSAVLQLGVTMDYSIFLYHSFNEQLETTDDKNEAMATAIEKTITSVIGSSITTVAGFIALCFMSFTLGKDLGIVMAKGVVFGVIACVTILPSLLLIFDRALRRTHHKPFLPEFNGIGNFTAKHYKIITALFLVLMVPAVYGYRHASVYYNLDSTLPKTLPSIAANDKLNEKFEMNATHMVLLPKDVKSREVHHMTDEMEQVDGVKFVLGLNAMKGDAIPSELIPEKLKGSLESDNWQLLLVGSEYSVASDEVNDQCDQLASIVKKYDDRGMLIGEAPCTKDLIEITAHDFSTVSTISIGVIFLIIMLVFKSLSLPVILVAVIESAIFVNMGIPYYTNTVLPFIASIVIGTIQLGATVDYAILMTNRYRTERLGGADKRTAVADACQISTKSIIVSALSFFAATFGVGLYSNIDMISSLCMLMARGALISMTAVIFVLPSMLMIFDGLVWKTTFKSRR